MFGRIKFTPEGFLKGRTISLFMLNVEVIDKCPKFVFIMNSLQWYILIPEAWGDHFSSAGTVAVFALTQRRALEVGTAQSLTKRE